MRSLPPPRETRKRKWMRIKRAVKGFFEKGYVTDPGAFLITSSCRKRSISIIKKSRFSRYRKARPKENVIGSKASLGLATANFVCRMAANATMPLVRPFGRSSNQMHLTVKF